MHHVKKRRKHKASSGTLIEKLSPEEASGVLKILLKNHPELSSEAEEAARQLLSSISSDEIADDVSFRIIGLDLDALNERAGAHSWGYVEPGEAATELLEEAIEDLVTDMKRAAENGLASTAESMCLGLIEGLYRVRMEKSDGPLGWDPDFPTREACSILEGCIRANKPANKEVISKKLGGLLRVRVPDWTDILEQAGTAALRD